MIPETSISIDPTLPERLTFWVPEPEDIDEEGFGFLRGTWAITDVTADEATAVTEAERAIVEDLNDLAKDFLTFDKLAGAVERGWAEDIDALDLEPAQKSRLARLLDPELDGYAPLEGLEVGVAGLVMALAAGGMYPAASCRSHPDSYSWSDRPVVLFAADRQRALEVSRLVERSRCGFAVDDARPELLVIEARSIIHTMRLAESILAQS
jgi:hypothetical protein